MKLTPDTIVHIVEQPLNEFEMTSRCVVVSMTWGQLLEFVDLSEKQTRLSNEIYQMRLRSTDTSSPELALKLKNQAKALTDGEYRTVRKAVVEMEEAIQKAAGKPLPLLSDWWKMDLGKMKHSLHRHGQAVHHFYGGRLVIAETADQAHRRSLRR